jgi:hypothetical protein
VKKSLKNTNENQIEENETNEETNTIINDDNTKTQEHEQMQKNEIELQQNNLEKNQENKTESLPTNQISSESEEINEGKESCENKESSEHKEDKSKFYDNLRTVIKTQGNILTMTSMAKEKIHMANEISIDQLKNFKDSSQKYGKYLKMIHEELQLVSDLMKKIKKEVTK